MQIESPALPSRMIRGCKPTQPSATGVEQSIGTLQTLAHDLRGPLANLSLLIERLGDLARPEAVESAAACIAKADRLIERMDVMLRASLRSAGSTCAIGEIHATLTDLPELVASVVGMNAALAEGCGVVLSTDCPEPIALAADAGLLERAIDNLVNNAIKHTGPGGAVTVGVRTANGCAVICVADQGPGFSPSDLPRLFQAFTPLSARDARGAPSHGLGLWIAKEIVERHGGTICAANKTDATGAILTIEIPLVRH